MRDDAPETRSAQEEVGVKITGEPPAAAFGAADWVAIHRHRTARKIGAMMPSEILVLADRVID